MFDTKIKFLSFQWREPAIIERIFHKMNDQPAKSKQLCPEKIANFEASKRGLTAKAKKTIYIVFKVSGILFFISVGLGIFPRCPTLGGANFEEKLKRLPGCMFRGHVVTVALYEIYAFALKCLRYILRMTKEIFGFKKNLKQEDKKIKDRQNACVSDPQAPDRWPTIEDKKQRIYIFYKIIVIIIFMGAGMSIVPRARFHSIGEYLSNFFGLAALFGLIAYPFAIAIYEIFYLAWLCFGYVLRVAKLPFRFRDYLKKQDQDIKELQKEVNFMHATLDRQNEIFLSEISAMQRLVNEKIN